jgi:hypothetical protein
MSNAGDVCRPGSPTRRLLVQILPPLPRGNQGLRLFHRLDLGSQGTAFSTPAVP